MKAFFNPDLDDLSDEEGAAEFRRGLASVGQDHRRILTILVPKLVALQERGDSAGALALIAMIRELVTGDDGPLH